MKKITIILAAIFMMAAGASSQTTAKEFYEKGKAESQAGDFKATGDDYRKAFELDPRSLPPVLSGIVAKLSAKDTAGSYDLLSVAIKDDPKNAYYYFVRGAISIAPSVLPAAASTAMSDFAKVLDLFPDNVGVYFIRGLTLFDRGELDGSISDLTKAIDLRAKLDPKSASTAYFFRGKARLQRKDFDGAIADTTQAIGLFQGDAEYYSVRAGSRLNKDDTKGAIADYTKAIEIDPTNVEYLTNRGLIRGDDHAGAIADFTKAIELDPANKKLPDLYFYRGVARLLSDDAKGAMADMNKTIALDPKYADAYDFRGALRGLINDNDASIADYTRAIEIDPRNADYYKHRAAQYDGMNKPALAKADEKRAAELKKP